MRLAAHVNELSSMGKLKLYWSYLRSSLWFIPALSISGAIVLAFWLIEAQWIVESGLVRRSPRFFAADPRGSEAMLSAIATSMITVAGVVFSITIVALSQASTQYSPRVLRNFMSDRRNQVVLGFFLGVFAYCLVLLRNVSWDNDQHRVPSLAILVAFLLALAAIGFLIFFIHHIASSIQASTMADAITAETIKVIDRLYPADDSDPEPPEEVKPSRLPDTGWHPVDADRFGYIQSIETGRLFKIACKRGLVIRLALGVGGFAIKGQPLVYLCGGGPPDKRLVQTIRINYAIDAHRTVEQDPAFGVQQLSDIAVKALSPGINDTTTAVTAVDYLSEIFSVLASRKLEQRRWFQAEVARVISRPANFPDLLDQAFQPIIENAAGKRNVMHHLLDGFRRVAESARFPEYREALRYQVNCVSHITGTIRVPETRKAIEAELREVLQQMGRH